MIPKVINYFTQNKLPKSHKFSFILFTFLMFPNINILLPYFSCKIGRGRGTFWSLRQGGRVLVIVQWPHEPQFCGPAIPITQQHGLIHPSSAGELFVQKLWQKIRRLESSGYLPYNNNNDNLCGGTSEVGLLRGEPVLVLEVCQNQIYRE